MKINPKILSIPPYISTSWKNIASLHVEEHQSILILVVTLLSGVRIEVPQLEQVMIETIFTAHARHIEQEEKAPLARLPINVPQMLPLKSIIAEMDHLGALLQHNPQEANSPDLPPEVVERITQLSKTIPIDDPNAVPKPEPHCNCVHCQIARALQTGCSHQLDRLKEQAEEIVNDDELTFRTWNVEPLEENLYNVINPLDENEHYTVFLGDPVGCTCGQKHCEHIRTVLNT